MADIIAVPPKKTSEVDLSTPFKNLLATRFNKADRPEDFDDAINELSKLRNSATSRILDKNEASLELMARYCDQLAALEEKIPPGDIQIPFKWKDAFDKGSFFTGRMSLTISSLSYERVCALFNLAAMQTQVANVQNVETDDGLRLAAKLLQQAAGIFNYLKSCISLALQQDPTPDMNPDTLAALVALMLAQAQEMFVVKAIRDKMKEAVTAKLSAQCEELYHEAYKAMQRDSLRNVWERDWLSRVSGKQAAYQGFAQYFQSRICNAQKLIGEEISRLRLAVESFKTAQQRAANPTLFQDYLNRAQRALAEAEKDNDFIYHERIPDSAGLEPVGRAALAKITPMPEKLSMNFKDLFENLTPVAVNQAISSWELRKGEVISTEVARLREAMQNLNGILASMNLPAALEEATGESVPQSLREKARAVREAGGAESLGKMITELPSLLQRNKEILDESQRLLEEEKEADDQLREKFKERWTRVPTETLTMAFRDNLSKYRTLLDNAIKADKIVQEKYEKNKEGIELLSRTEDELEASVPSASQAAAENSRSPAAQELRQLISKVDTLKNEREALEDELKSATTDMKSVFLAALNEIGSINEPSLSLEKLSVVYGPLQQRVKESLAQQQSLVEDIKRVNAEFIKATSEIKEIAEREELLKQLAAAHDAYMELQGNLQEGIKFYGDLTQLLLTFQSKISDYCFARKTEKEELLKDFSSNLANQDTTPTPVRQPPPRPPPPAVSVDKQAAATEQEAPPTTPTPPTSCLPYPIQIQGMPMPYYPTYPGAYGAYSYQGQQQGQEQAGGYPYPYFNPGYPYPQQRGN